MTDTHPRIQPDIRHTPTPWKLHDRWLFASTGPLAIASGYQDWVTAPGGSKYDEWLANAAFIVEAVNSHAALKSRVEELTKALQGILDENDEFRKAMPADWDGDPLEDACEAARRALAPSLEGRGGAT